MGGLYSIPRIIRWIVANCRYNPIISHDKLFRPVNINIETHNKQKRMNAYSAAKFGYLNIVKYFVEHEGFDVNEVNKNGKTLLKFAECHYHTDVFEYLVLRAGAKLDTTQNYQYILETAIDNGKLELVQYLIDQAYKANFNEYSMEYLPYLAARSGHLHILEYLIDVHNVDLNLENYGQKLYHTAANFGHMNILEFCVKNKMDISKPDSEGQNCLHIAAGVLQTHLIPYLIENGCDVNAVNSLNNQVIDPPLYRAAQNDDINSVRVLIESGADMYYEDSNGWTAFDRILYYGNLDNLQYFIDQGYDIHRKSKKLQTSIHSASASGNLKVIQFLIDKGVSIDYGQHNDIISPLLSAAKNDSLELIQFLIEKGCDVNAVCENGYSVVHTALQNYQTDIVKYLITTHNVNLNTKETQYGYTPLLSAMVNGHYEIAKLMLEKGVDVNCITNDGHTLLHYATYEIELLKLVTEHNLTNINAKTYEKGSTPLHIATARYELKAFQHLIDIGADINAVDHRRRSVLQTAIKREYFDKVKILVENGVKIVTNPNNGSTILHYAAIIGCRKIMAYLISLGLDVNAKDYNSYTVLHAAVENEKFDVVKQLVRKGADLHAKDGYGWTAAHIAAYVGNLKILKYLDSKGGKLDARVCNKSTITDLAALRSNKMVIKYLMSRDWRHKAKRIFA